MLRTPMQALNTVSAVYPQDYRQLRIAIISDAESERNGVGAYYHDLADVLGDHVDQIELICPGHAHIRHGLKFALPGDATQKVWLPPLRQINARVKRLEPHVIIVPTPGPFGLLGARLAKRLDTSLVVGFHTHFEKIMDLYWSRWFGYLTVSYFELLNRHLFKQSRIILANSDEMVRIAHGRSKKPVELMGTPIPRAFLATPLPPQNPQVKSILYAGRLAAEKNVAAIISAAEKLPDFHFSIAGDGPIRNEVMSAVAKLPNLDYLGWLSRQDMLTTMDRADMLVLPSHVESFGTIAMEAMARRKLVLVSAHCGIANWPELKPGLFVINDEENTAQAIRRAAGLSGDIRYYKAKKAREGAERLSQWNIDNWLRILSRHASLATVA